MSKTGPKPKKGTLALEPLQFQLAPALQATGLSALCKLGKKLVAFGAAIPVEVTAIVAKRVDGEIVDVLNLESVTIPASEIEAFAAGLPATLRELEKRLQEEKAA